MSRMRAAWRSVFGRTRSLPVAAGQSDTGRWGNPRSYPAGWDSRAELAARWITRAGSRVLDIGCGPMKLKAMIPVPVTYVPADLNPWLPGILKIDLNRGQYPEGMFDYAVLLGVVEYLWDPVTALRAIRQRSAVLVASYCIMTGGTVARRTADGWVNHLDEPALKKVLADAGWTIRDERLYQERQDFTQRIFLCE